MNTVGKMLVANLKMTSRDKQSLFWTLLFPTLFIVIFGLFNFEDIGHSKIAFIDEANSEISQGLKEGLAKIDFFDLSPQYSSADAAKTELQNGKIDFIIIVPALFSAAPPAAMPDVLAPAAPTGPATIQVYYDQANTQINPIVLSTLNQFINEANFQITKTQKVFVLKSDGVSARSIKYLDILTPGIMAMAVMSAAIIGISSEIVKYREQRLLRRLTATPLKVRDFLIAQVLSYLILAVIQLSLIVIVAKFAYHVHFYGNMFLMYGLSLMGSLLFLSVGFTLAGIAKTVNAAEAMAQAIFQPLMFLSGTFFPTEALPPAIYAVVKYLPLTPLIEALRQVANYDAGLFEIRNQLYLIGAWIIVTFVIAWKTFRFEKSAK